AYGSNVAADRSRFADGGAVAQQESPSAGLNAIARRRVLIVTRRPLPRGLLDSRGRPPGAFTARRVSSRPVRSGTRPATRRDRPPERSKRARRCCWGRTPFLARPVRRS